MSKMIILGVIFCTFLSCSPKAAVIPILDSPNKQEQVLYEKSALTALPCTFSEGRKTTETFYRQHAKVIQKGTVFLLEVNNGERVLNYVPCNLPTDLQQDGLELIISGEVKSVKPNEMMLGLPLRLLDIRK